jgi:hypothetical protein
MYNLYIILYKLYNQENRQGMFAITQRDDTTPKSATINTEATVQL